jgi:RNA polymerase sigma-70 factor, ECF subfamily
VPEKRSMNARILPFDPEERYEARRRAWYRDLEKPRGRIPLLMAPLHYPESRDWPGDERAVALFLSGDTIGFDQIVRHYATMVFRLVSRLVGTDEAEDIVQETFLRAFRGLERFRGECSLKTWLYTIALNRVRARQGTLAKMRALLARTRPDESGEDRDLLDEAADTAASPEEDAIERQRRLRLHAAIRALPEDFRQAIVLRDLEGLAYDEIARVLGIPIGTVRSRIARGRAALLEELS